MHTLYTREFISKGNIYLESFRVIGVSKIIVDIGCDVKEYVPRIGRKFYAHLSYDIDNVGKPTFQKVFI